MKKTVSICALLMLVIASSASALNSVPSNPIAMRDFAGWGTSSVAGPIPVNFADPAYTGAASVPLASCVSSAVMSLSPVGSLSGNGATNRFNAKGWMSATPNEYIDFTVTMKGGQAFVADKFYVALKGSNTAGDKMDIMFSKDGGAWTALETGILNDGATYVNRAYDVSALFGTVHSSLDIRFYDYGVQAGGTNKGLALTGTGTFGVGQPNIGGTYYVFGVTGTPVPEPATLAMLSIGGLAVYRRRHA